MDDKNLENENGKNTDGTDEISKDGGVEYSDSAKKNPQNSGSKNSDFGIFDSSTAQKTVSNQKSGHIFIKGTITGLVSMLLIVTIVFSAFWKKGYLHVGTNGEIYVQDMATKKSNANGIGEKVTEKLDILQQILSSFYFEDVDEDKVADNIYKAYLNSFGDKYTTYYTADEYKAINQTLSGTYYGIGVVVSKNDDGTIKVVNPYENCPGAEAGMKAGDTITKVNGGSVADRDLNTVVADIKGAEGTTVQIEITRDGVENPMTLTVERRKIDIPSVTSKVMDDQIGYIYVSEFDENTDTQFIDMYKNLLSQGIKGLVIDIRSNPGGSLKTVVNMLDELLPDGLIVYTQDKDGKKVEYKGKNSDQINIPLSVLVNGDSASASEIFSGAIQDYGVGTIVGTQTFGKGIVQTIRPLTDGSAVKLTTQKYFTPKGQDIQGKGVTPDVVVELDPSLKDKTDISPSDDNQLQKGIEIIKSKITGQK